MSRNVLALPERTDAAQERAIAVLCVGGTIQAAAQAAGVDRRTVHRWQRHDAAFVAALNDARSVVADQLRSDQAALIGAAVDALRDMLDPDAPPALRLRAALGVLNTFGKPSPPAYGPTEPADVEAAWQAAREHAERERRKAAFLQELADSALPVDWSC